MTYYAVAPQRDNQRRNHNIIICGLAGVYSLKPKASRVCCYLFILPSQLLGLPDLEDDSFEHYHADMEGEPGPDHQQMGVSQQWWALQPGGRLPLKLCASHSFTYTHTHSNTHAHTQMHHHVLECLSGFASKGCTVLTPPPTQKSTHTHINKHRGLRGVWPSTMQLP